MSANTNQAKGPRMRKMASPGRLKSLQTVKNPTVLSGRKLAGGLHLGQNRVLKSVVVVFRVPLQILKMITPNYFLNSFRELRGVTWTTRRETWRLLLAVFTFAIIFGLMIAGVDKLLDTIFKNTVIR